MSKLGKKLIVAAKEGVEIARNLRNDWINDLPDTIRIGAHDIAICKMGPAWAADENAFGMYEHAQQTIKLQANMPTRYVAVETVLHEISHAIMRLFGLVASKDDDTDLKEEPVAQVTGLGFTQVFRDNPELLEWVTETLHPEEEEDE